MRIKIVTTLLMLTKNEPTHLLLILSCLPIITTITNNVFIYNTLLQYILPPYCLWYVKLQILETSITRVLSATIVPMLQFHSFGVMVAIVIVLRLHSIGVIVAMASMVALSSSTSSICHTVGTLGMDYVHDYGIKYNNLKNSQQ